MMRRATIYWGLLVLLALTGCSSLRVPRIDPSGERIFLPNDPTLSPVPAPAPRGWLPSCDFSNWRPSFKRPDRPLPDSLLTGPVNGLPLDRPPQHGPCGPNAPADKKCFQSLRHGKGMGVALKDKIHHHFHKNGCETVTPRGVPGAVCLAPQTLAVPVGREVVLVAGMCGDDGYLITDQPMEWMLSNESVGHFVDVGEPAPRWCKKVQCREGYKMGVDYALTKTTDKRQMITRGTPSTKDDVLLQRGQTWVSLTSPSEGTSYVTTLATDGDRWDQRRRTATIHWVNADVRFPASQQLEANQTAELATTVLRLTDGQGAENYIVNYKFQDSTSAEFVNTAGAVAGTSVSQEMRTGADGVARAFVRRKPGVPVSQIPVVIEVYRPPRDATPRLLVGRSVATLNWLSASLSIQCDRDQVVVENAFTTFQFTVTNPGNQAARNVIATISIPRAFEVQNTNPAVTSEVAPNWNFALGDLGPGQSRRIDVNVRALPGFANTNSSQRVTASVRGDPGLTAQTPGCVVQVVAQSLRLQYEPVEPGPVNVGQLKVYRAIVTNVGRQTLTNVQVIPEYPLALTEGNGMPSGGRYRINQSASLEPGASAEFEVRFEPNQPGQFTHRVTVLSDQGHTATQSQILEAVLAPRQEPVANLEIVKRGPAEVPAGGFADYEIFVANTGDVAMINVELSELYPKSMTPIESTRGQTPVKDEIRDSYALVWRIGRMEPNDRRVFKLRCTADQLDANAINEAVVKAEVSTTGQKFERSSRVTTKIVAGNNVPGNIPPAGGGVPGGPGAPGGQPPAASLDVRLEASANSVQVGQPINYAISLANLLNQEDRDVVVSIAVPSGMEQVRFPSIPPEQIRVQDGVYTLAPIATVRANEQLRSAILFSAVPTVRGPHTVQVDVVSRNSPTPIRREWKINAQ